MLLALIAERSDEVISVLKCVMAPQADINQQADEFEEQLLRSRLDMEVRNDELIKALQ